MVNSTEKINYTDEELADAHIFPHGLTDEELKVVDEEMRILRLQHLLQMTEEEKLQNALFSLKYKMRNFIEEETNSDNKNFSTFFVEYLEIVRKKQIEFAQEISIHPTKLNQILRDKQMPNIALMYRLEKHSGGVIPAIMWWKLYNKRIEANIKNDTAGRELEMNKVHYHLNFDK